MANTPEVPDDQDHADDPRPQPLDRATPAYRRDLIAPMVMQRMTIRAIEQALAVLPPQKRPLHRSHNAIGNDVLAHWLAIHRQKLVLIYGRAANTIAGPPGIQLPGTPPDGAMRVVVEYVDD